VFRVSDVNMHCRSCYGPLSALVFPSSEESHCVEWERFTDSGEEHVASAVKMEVESFSETSVSTSLYDILLYTAMGS